MQLGQLAAAEQAYLAALALEPSHQDARYNLTLLRAQPPEATPQAQDPKPIDAPEQAATPDAPLPPSPPVLLLEQRLRKEALRRELIKVERRGSLVSRLFTPGHALCLLLLWLMTAQVFAAPPRAELLPGADRRDWLLIIEADGERQSSELAITPLLRQFAVGKVTMSRVSAPQQSLTRWQIPLHLLDTSPQQVPALPLGAEQTPSIPFPPRSEAGNLAPAPAISPIELQARVLRQGPLYPGQPFVYQLSLWLPPTSPSRPAMPSPFAASATISGNHRQAPACPAV